MAERMMGSAATAAGRAPSARRNGVGPAMTVNIAAPTSYPFGLTRAAEIARSEAGRIVQNVHAAERSVASAACDGAVIVASGTVAGIGVGAAAASAAIILTLFLASVYTPRSRVQTQGIAWYPTTALTPLALAFLLAAAFGPLDSSWKSAAFAALSLVGLVSLRVATWQLLTSHRGRREWLGPTLVVGSGTRAAEVADRLEGSPSAGLEPVGILSPDGAVMGVGAGSGALPEDVPFIIKHYDVEQVLLVPDSEADTGVYEALMHGASLDSDFALVPPLSDLFVGPGMASHVASLPMIDLGRGAVSTLPGKRALDIVFGVIALVLALPVMIATAIAIKLDDGGPILFRQRRVGLGGCTYTMLKFRSMVVDADSLVIDLRDRNERDGLLFKMADDPRVTRVGKIIRRLAIDELPQLANVLRGDMSLVGPRPLPVDPDAFGAREARRHATPPGLTGFWQVRVPGSGSVSYAEMLEHDLAYIRRWSLGLDLWLLARTAPALLMRWRNRVD